MNRLNEFLEFNRRISNTFFLVGCLFLFTVSAAISKTAELENRFLRVTVETENGKWSL
jgi:hypothetical protein